MEEKESNSKRKFIKKLVKGAAGVVLMPVVTESESFSQPLPSVTPSPSRTPSASRTPSRSPSPSLSRTPSLSPSPSVSLSPTPSFSPSLTPTPTFSPSLSPSPSLTPSPSTSPSVTPTPSMSPSVTITPSMSPSTTVTPSVSSTPMPTPSPSSVVNGVEAMLKEQGIEIGTFNPNPTSDRSFLIVVTNKPVDVKVDIYDAASRRVFNRSYSLRSGSNSIEVELPSGSLGFYQVLMDFEGKVVGRRLISK